MLSGTRGGIGICRGVEIGVITASWGTVVVEFVETQNRILSPFCMAMFVSDLVEPGKSNQLPFPGALSRWDLSRQENRIQFLFRMSMLVSEFIEAEKSDEFDIVVFEFLETIN